MILLALIRLDENAYGFPISKEIEKRSGREISVASVYATLERLEAKGFVSSEIGEPTPERGGWAKRYFRITAKGVREVRDTRRAVVKLAPVVGMAESLKLVIRRPHRRRVAANLGGDHDNRPDVQRHATHPDHGEAV